MVGVENNKALQYKAELILVFVSLTWGLSFPLIKLGLLYSSPFTFVLIRFTLTTLIFSAIFFRKIIKFKFTDIKYGLYLGFFLFIGFLTQTAGLKYTTASNSAFITGTNIALLPFAQILIIKSKPKIENVIGIIIVLVGLYFLTNMHKDEVNIGDLITILCAVSFAFYIVYLDKYSQTYDINALIFGQFIATVFLALLSVIFVEKYFFEDVSLTINETLIVSLIFNAIFNTLIGIILSNKFQRYTTPVRAGLLYNLEQVFAVIASYIILNEILSGRQILGAVIMLIGVVFSEFFGLILKKQKYEKFKADN